MTKETVSKPVLKRSKPKNSFYGHIKKENPDLGILVLDLHFCPEICLPPEKRIFVLF